MCAGDTFCGAVLGKVLEKGLADYADEELLEMLKFANTAAGIITERRGALKAMPELSEVYERMEEHKQ